MWATIVVVVGPVDSARAGLIYWHNFDGGDGVADSPVNIGGDLGISNTGGLPPVATAFSAAGGIFGGSYDASSNSTPGVAVPGGAGGLASTGATEGTAVNLGTMTSLTVTLWIKTDQLPTTTSNQAARLIVLGAAGVNDVQQANSLSIVVRSAVGGTPSKTNTVQILSHAIDSSNGGIGNNPADAVVAGQWTFLALSYDGTSTLGNDSATQNAATGGLSSVNGQYYRGTDSSSIVRTPVPLTTTAGNAAAASQGAFSFGASSVVFLAGRPNGSRQFDGWIDDVRIYDSVLSESDVESVRTQGLIGVPEPRSFLLIVLSSVGLFAIARKRQLPKPGNASSAPTENIAPHHIFGDLLA
jgi:hypothetical protein